MRIASGIVATGTVLFAAGGLGWLAAWAVPVGTLVLLVGGIGLIVALEDRDAVEGLLPTRWGPRPPDDGPAVAAWRDAA